MMTYGNGIWEAITIGFLLSLIVNFVYYTLAVTIPRSGGDYVYISRILHPALGFLSAGLTGIFGTLVLASTFGASVWVTAGLSPLLSTLGQGGLSAMVTSTTALTVAGVLTTVFFGVLLAFGGNKTFYRLNNVLYAIAIVGALVGAAAFARCRPRRVCQPVQRLRRQVLDEHHRDHQRREFDRLRPT